MAARRPLGVGPPSSSSSPGFLAAKRRASPAARRRPTPAPATAAPTPRRDGAVRDYLHDLSRGESGRLGTPQRRARDWLLIEDGLGLDLPPLGEDGGGPGREAAEARLRQRFALATCYYSLGIGDGGVVAGWMRGEECGDGDSSSNEWEGLGCTEDGLVRVLVLGESRMCVQAPCCDLRQVR